jgi:hypothetical protein
VPEAEYAIGKVEPALIEAETVIFDALATLTDTRATIGLPVVL